MHWFERRFRAMGTDVHLLVGGPDARHQARHATRRVRELERRWSRFDDRSEISRLNRADGRPTTVSPETVELVERAVAGWQATGGAFDPTVWDSVTALGYDRDFATLGEGAPSLRPAQPARGCAGFVVSRETGVVRLPEGVRIDPGGIGKGLAADRIVRELVGDGARGCCVNIGGDLRVAGRAPHGAPWLVEIEDPLRRGERIGCLRLARGAAATSSRTRRAWSTPSGRRHHLVDPSTGDSARSGVASVTVVTGFAWRAEVLAKAAFVAGPGGGAAVVEREGAAGLIVDDEGRVHRAGPIEELLA